MKPLKTDIPTQPLPKGIPPKEPKGENVIIRSILIGAAILLLWILSSYIK